ncbi:hypothetical protein [Pseudomonas huanghezhanensis]|uniref:hypothetical protein n=1 Tax=Pseudomonas huanghezhanensis TaxID=3002903 RepID=UPI002285989D|nr:hypothetical protein [Pseudomonas sp. BSw22131]
MNIELTLLLIDDEITGLELGDIFIGGDGKVIDSGNYNPSQSIMIFIFLSGLLDELQSLHVTKRNNRSVVNAANSSFYLQLEKKDKNLLIKNGATTIEISFEDFCGMTYARIKSWLDVWQLRIDPEDTVLCELIESLGRFCTVFNYGS